MPAAAIGIDLGTTHCCVGVWQDSNVEILSNDVGSRLTPSVVAFTDEGRLIGEPAKGQAHKNAKNTYVAAHIVLLTLEPSPIRGRRRVPRSIISATVSWLVSVGALVRLSTL